MSRVTILALFGLAALAACAPTMDDLSAACAGYGFQPDSAEFFECRQREMHAYEAKMNSMNNAAMGFWM